MGNQIPATETTQPLPTERSGFPRQYNPADHESRVRAGWERTGVFSADPGRVRRGEARAYAILIPPPNVTDRLHLGHALNNTLQDVLVRAYRMMGYETLWMPGTDHAGIATQAVVERRLRQEGLLTGPLRQAMTREAFLARVQAYKDEYEATITEQLKRMGCSCDWSRQRFTMDATCTRAVYEAFFRLFREGLIYRGKRLVNWDPVLQTAVADDECYDDEIEGHFYYLRYPLVRATTDAAGRPRHDPDPQPVTWSELARYGFAGAEHHAPDDQAWLTVATTRPETYLGDTAVAVNPRDPRTRALRGLFVELPIVGRLIPVIEDEYVIMPRGLVETDEEPEDPKAVFATGFLKVTPAHDVNDYEIWQRHRTRIPYPPINILAPDGTISDRHGWTDVGNARMLVGLSREEARHKVVEEFRARGLLEEIRPCTHVVKHSDRSKTVIEPYLSDQWYVRVTDDRLRGAALRALAEDQRAAPVPTPPQPTRGDGTLRFHPDRYARTYESWHHHIRDWCISRQLWWGHRIPLWERSRAPDPHREAPVLEAWQRQGRIFATFTDAPVSAGTADASSLPDTRPCVICVRDPVHDREATAWLEAHGFAQDPDVLDTWFSSALWPLSTMGWPEDTDLLRAFNPTSTLCTAREIITLWVSRMVMFNRYFLPRDWPDSPRQRRRALRLDPGSRGTIIEDMGHGLGPVPFRDVFIHALILDGEGRKMSKSAGNGIDPLDIIDSHGADAMRFTLVHMTTHTQDVRLPVQPDPATGRNTSPRFDLGRNFCNKLWNAAAFCAGVLTRAQPHADLPSPTPRLDRWMLSRLADTRARVEQSLTGFQFSEYAQVMYDLLWHDFCDWYIEGVKSTATRCPAQQRVLAGVFETILRLLHPIVPFVTEAIWERWHAVRVPAPDGLRLDPPRIANLLASAPWPQVAPALRDESVEAWFEPTRGLIGAIREARARHGVPVRKAVTLHALEPLDAETEHLVRTLAQVGRIVSEVPTGPAAAFPFQGRTWHISDLADTLDRHTERQRLEQALAQATRMIETLERRLSNREYVERAPAAVVEQTRAQLRRAQADRDAAAAALATLCDQP